MSNESDESAEEESEKLGSGSGLFRTFGTGLNELLCGAEFLVGVTLGVDDGSFGGGGG